MEVKPKYITLLEAATYSGFTPSRLRDLATSGQLTHYKIEGELRFDIANLDAFMAIGKRKGVQA